MRRQLQALHAQAMGLVMQLEALIEQCGGTTEGCVHPPEKRRRTQTLADDKPKFRCEQCGEDVT